MEHETPGLKRKSMIAVLVGVVLMLFGLVLTLTDPVVYFGEWPDQRHMYLSGIGYPLFVIGIFSALVGLYSYLAEPKAPDTQDIKTEGKDPDQPSLEPLPSAENEDGEYRQERQARHGDDDH